MVLLVVCMAQFHSVSLPSVPWVAVAGCIVVVVDVVVVAVAVSSSKLCSYKPQTLTNPKP